MRTARIIGSILVVTTVAVLLLGSVALADPAVAPMSLFSANFESSTLPSAMTVTPITFQGYPSTAAWGRIGGSGVGGSWGLWCSGMQLGRPGTYWPTYPLGSWSWATVDLPQLADMYSSRLGFAYNMPTLGAADESAFGVRWHLPSSPDNDPHSSFPLTGATAFSTVTYDMSGPSNQVVLSRAAGVVEFLWFDLPEGALFPKNGKGATIDNLVIDGYKYGPVTPVTTSQDSGHVRISWTEPRASTAGGAPVDTRPSFRVWRVNSGQATYNEIAGSPFANGTTSVVDDAASSTGAYFYYVQAWDTGSGAGYGPLASVKFGNPTGLTLSVSRSATKVKVGQSATLTYNVTNVGTTSLSSILVTDTLGTVGTIGSLAAGGATNSTLKRVVSPVVDKTYNSRASGSGVSATASTTVRVPVQRLAGLDRIKTAIEVSKRGFPGTAPAVVVATGRRWQEGLVAASLAGQVGGPLLLVNPASLPSEVVTEIKRLKPLVIYVVGDATSLNALNAATYTALKAIPTYGAKVQARIAGSDSYGTSREVAARVASLRGIGGTVFLARGDGANFADALAASSLAARLRAPIVLTSPASLLGSASSAITAVKPTEIVVCGGTGAVTSATAAAAAAAAGIGGYDRYGGATRYETAVLIADYGVAKIGQPSIVYVSSGQNYPDALGGGVLAGIGSAAWQPVLLTAPTALSAPVSAFITGHPSVDHATILGGTGSAAAPVVNAAVETSLYDLMP